LLEALLAFIGRATDSTFGLFGAIYEFQWPAVLHSLESAHRRGAHVEVIYDAIPGSTGPKVATEAAINSARIAALCHPRTVGSIMLNKFLVLTQDDQPGAVWTGSTNITENGIVLELSTLPGVENVALAPSQGHQRPRRAARRRRRTTMIKRMEHVGIVVDDLAAATEFFLELGLELQGEGPVECRWVDRLAGLDGVRAEVAVVQTPDGHGRLELTKFHTPSSRTTTGTRRRTHRASAISHSPSKTSTPSSPTCEPAARNSWASWSATRTATGSATSAARRGSSSN
jgi:hypothetical protein